jgi:hypothetical protein
MAGWTWASIEEVEALFNAYGNMPTAIQTDFGYMLDKSTRITAAGPPRDTPPEGIMYIAVVIGGGEVSDPGIVDSAHELGGGSSALNPWLAGALFWR